MAEYFSQYMWTWAAYLLTAVIHASLLIQLPALGALVFIWAERKVSGRIQDRLGPTRVGGKFGWLQSLADGIKLITKEDLMPNGADGMLFRVAPYISFCASFAALMALPFADGWVAVNVNVGVFFILAVMGLEVFGVILGGYASASKWSLFGSMREAAQVVSYEVPLGLCVVVPVLVTGSMDLVQIGNMQAGFFTNWLIFHDPFTFITFWVYFTCALASVNRAPFDLAEAESELVAGFHTEYSGIRWSYFFMAEYGSMITVSGLAAILFFGGWNGPIPITDALGLTHANHPVLGYLGNFLGFANMIIKASIGVVAMIWIRWTLPRLRIDQVMKMCLKFCVPIAAVMFLGVTLWTYQFPGGVFFKNNYDKIYTTDAPAPAVKVAEDKSSTDKTASQANQDTLLPAGEKVSTKLTDEGRSGNEVGNHFFDAPLTPGPSPRRGEGSDTTADQLAVKGE